MKRAAIFVLFVVGGCRDMPACLSQSDKNGPAGINVYGVWHRATAAECSTEMQRELKAMNGSGFYGDPPITMATSWFIAGESWSENPCGYADDSNPPNFKPRYTHTTLKGSEEEITEEEFKSGYASTSRVKDGNQFWDGHQ